MRAVAVLALAAAGLATPAVAFDERARHDYLLDCSGCHRPDGAGVEGAVPSFEMLGAFLSSHAGREYVVRVPGVAHAPLDDARLAALLNYVVAELAGVAGARPFTEGEIARHRRSPLLDPLAARARLLDSSVAGAPIETGPAYADR